MSRVDASPRSGELHRSLGLAHVTLAGVGTILGAGIYVLIGEAAAEAGPLAWASFLVAAVVTAVTGLSYGELASMFPRAGAGFEYAMRAFGMRTAFLTGWLTVSAEVVAAGAVALGFGSYLDALVGVDAGVAAVLLLVVGALVAATGALTSVVVAGVLTVVEAGGLVAVSAIGLVDFDASRVVGGADGWAVLSGSALVFFAYIGFEDVATFAEEARDPRRTIPRALLLAIVVTTVLYVLVAVTAIGAVGAEALAASGAPLAEVASGVLGESAGDVLGVVALAATGNTALLLLMASCRRIYGMASAGALPRRLAAVSNESGIPVTGLALVAGIASVVSLWGDIGEVADVTNFALFVAFVMVNAAVLQLRRSAPGAVRGFRSPGRLPGRWGRRWPWLAPLPVVGILSTVVLIGNLDVTSLVGGTVLLAVGIVLAVARRRWPEPPVVEG